MTTHKPDFENPDARHLAGSISDQLHYAKMEEKLRNQSDANFTPTSISPFTRSELGSRGKKLTPQSRELGKQVDASVGGNMQPYDYEQASGQANNLLRGAKDIDPTAVGIGNSIKGHAWQRRQQHELASLKNRYWKEQAPEGIENLHGAARDSAHLAYLKERFEQDTGNSLSREDIPDRVLSGRIMDNNRLLTAQIESEDQEEGIFSAAAGWLREHKAHLASGGLIAGGIALGTWAATEFFSDRNDQFAMEQTPVPVQTIDINEGDFRDQTSFANGIPDPDEEGYIEELGRQATDAVDLSMTNEIPEAAEIEFGLRVLQINDTPIPEFPMSPTLSNPGEYSPSELFTLLGQQEELYDYFECGPEETFEGIRQTVCKPVEPIVAERPDLDPLILASIYQNSGYDWELRTVRE